MSTGRRVYTALCLLALVTLAACSNYPSGDWFGETLHPGQIYDPGNE
jgi:hypothetical protein